MNIQQEFAKLRREVAWLRGRDGHAGFAETVEESTADEKNKRAGVGALVRNLIDMLSVLEGDLPVNAEALTTIEEVVKEALESLQSLSVPKASGTFSGDLVHFGADETDEQKAVRSASQYARRRNQLEGKGR